MTTQNDPTEAEAGSQRRVKRYVVTETIEPRRRPKLQTERRELTVWEAVVLQFFDVSDLATRAEMLKAAAEVKVDKLCAVIRDEFPDSDIEGCRREMLEKLSERLGRAGVTPNAGDELRALRAESGVLRGGRG